MHFARAAAPLMGLALVLGACSSGGGATPSPTPAPTAAPSSAAPAGSGTASIDLASSSLGTILVDGTGMTLYEFTPDSNGTSTCSGSCAANWPPLVSAGAPTVGSGLTATDFGTITRADDGSSQVTFDGHPLYRFAGDAKPGDTNGQGLLSKWYVVGADGSMIESGAGATASPAAGGGASIELTDSSLGRILTDGEGRTLYVFTADATNTSNCTDTCLQNWPALTTDGAPTVGAGLDAADFATITRADDGSSQVTFYGHPLYYFAADTAPGDTNGQGLLGKWYVVGADGSMIEPAAAPTPTATSGYKY